MRGDEYLTWQKVQELEPGSEAFNQPRRPSPLSPPGGLGEAVSSAVVNETGFSVQRLAVSQVPRSGKPHELLRVFGIDRDAIVQAVHKALSGSSNAK